ncbi:hypothetical protein BZA70DRAFT_274016 [Myxozyma melibiosi]|uniref:RRM domain-containing protein n=1 Tax=Myxozyma melibiosi TaxID=54550 RepID=A0ABR1FFW8_9ASCO
MADKGAGKVVFVGNIPYDQSEEQIMDVFQSVGPVANFRFVFDKETGRPKGFGFVEYHDSETAASAVRNLNNYELNNRALRVDFSHETSIGPNVLTSGNKESLISSLPTGTPPPPNLSTPDAISQTLSAFTPPQMLNILQELKSAATQNPAKLRELLKSSPQLSYAVVQSMLLMGLVDASAVASAVDATQLAAQKQQQQQRLLQQQQQQQIQPEYAAAPARSTNSPAPGIAIPSHIDPQKAALIKQVIELSDEQIANLPDAQRAVLIALREKIRRGEFDLV